MKSLLTRQGRRPAQEVEELPADKTVVEEIAAARGRALDVDPNTPPGRYIRAFTLVSEGRTSVTITDEIVERARAT